jgi:hypothetical protein
VLIDRHTLDGIRDGRIDLQFRRWRRPTVRAGGTLLTAIGQLGIDAVDVVAWHDVTEDEARRAGFPDRAALAEALGDRDGALFRIAVRLAGPDPRIALRTARPTSEELPAIVARLERWDRSSASGPWTRAALDLIDDRPAVLAATLAEAAGVEKARFKANVRKLKSLGLTESLAVGYRLSIRGTAVREHLSSIDPARAAIARGPEDDAVRTE